MGAIEIIRWAIAGALSLLASFLLFAVPVLIFLECRRIVRNKEDRGVSGVPLVGTLLGTAAICVVPLGTFRERAVWLWTPLSIEVAVFLVALLVFRWSGMDKSMKEIRADRSKK